MRSPDAKAYNGSEHIRFPDQAYQILNIMRRGAFYAEQASRLTTNQSVVFAPLTSPPPGVDAAGWAAFRTAALNTPAVLDNVLVRLADPPLASPDCAGVFPSLSAGKHLYLCRAGDLPFAPLRHWGQNSNNCYLRRGYVFGGADQNPTQGGQIVPFFQGLPSNFTGAVLGLWATWPDDANEDTQLWFRPSNSLLSSDIKGAIEEGSADVIEGFLLLDVCMVDFFLGGDCLNDASEIANEIDLARLIDQQVGSAELDTYGQLTLGSNDWPFTALGVSLPGLWHFININVGADGNFNRPPGIKLTAASPSGGFNPDAVDLAVISAGDLFGVTVQPDRSAGVQNYAQFDDANGRSTSDWINAAVGHTEFSPLDNLARYGWLSYTQPLTAPAFGGPGPHGGGAGANGLGWILHAIGDAMCPHHTIGSLGWGHPLWEKYAGDAWEGTLNVAAFQEESLLTHYPDMVRALGYAYQWWTFINSAKGSSTVANAAYGKLITGLATETFQSPFAQTPGRAFKSGVTLDYVLDKTDQRVSAQYGNCAPGQTGDCEVVELRDRMLRTIGASIAFLVQATATPLPANPPSPCACPAGTARSGQTFTGINVNAPNGTCKPCGTDAFKDLPNLLDGRCVAICPEDKPTVQNGVCVAVGACPVNTPFVKNGVCVAGCCPTDPTCPAATPVRENGVCGTCSTPFFANYRECLAACPAGQVPSADGTKFCVPTSSPNTQGLSGACSSKILPAGSDACVARAGMCTVNSDCCSKNCRLADGICRGRPGESCEINNDCLSGVCSGGICATGQAGSRCQTTADCGGTCLATGACDGNGAQCSTDTDCTSCNCVFVCSFSLGGGPCQTDQNCITGQCTAGVCNLGTGGTCQATAQCITGDSCLNGQCCAGEGQGCMTSTECCAGLCVEGPGTQDTGFGVCSSVSPPG